MKFKRILLILAICIITFVCLIGINRKYDKLARYQYDDENARRLIKEYLPNSTIDYIIEYAIDPSTFIDYIECDKFNIFHTDLYHFISSRFWYLSNQESVDLSELILGKIDGDCYEFIDNHLEYSYDELTFYLNNLTEKHLLNNPNNVNLVIGENETVSNYKPVGLMNMDDTHLIRKEAYESYQSLLNYLNEKLKVKDCGITVLNAYLSYEQLNELHSQNNNIIPGNDSHQLGLSLDLCLDKFSSSEENMKLLNDSLCQFGFVLEECSLADYHIRYLPKDRCNINEQ